MSSTGPQPTSVQAGLLAGKVAIITGASRGIGEAAARAFADAGAAVVLAARDEGALRGIADSIEAGGGQALAVPTDVTEPYAVQQLVDGTVDVFGRLDVAFNNAGSGQPPTPTADMPVEQFDRTVQLNLRGIFLSMKYEIPAMLTAGGGAIVNMSSTAGLAGRAGLAAYAAAKHGIIGLTRCAALDYADSNIRINAVAPGTILTHHLDRVPEQVRDQIAHAIPAQRLGTVEEVCSAAVWLCSDQASYINGATISIDGGKLAAGA
jgi:NAD(P)-dependent dehydrogenase (short-subunit alcohol dehydrogenase family)